MKGTESSSPEFPWLNFHETEEVNTRILQRIHEVWFETS